MPGGLRPPIEVIETWTINYINPETGGQYVVIVTAVMLGLVYLVVGLRLWARLRLANNGGIDDLLIVLNMIPLTGMAVCLGLAINKFGFNRHVWDVPAGTLIQARKVTIALEELYLISTALTKISILLFYRRLAAGTITKVFQYSVYAAIAFVVMSLITWIVNIFLICTPFPSFWLQADFGWLLTHENDFHCQNEGAALVASAAISALQDFLACGLPMILFWKLQIPRRQKFALGAIFSVGFFLCICAVLRSIYIYRTYYTTYDMTWEARPAWLWLSVEAHLAIICASAPALKIFFKHTLKDYTSSFRRSGKSSGSDRSAESGQAGYSGDHGGSSRGDSRGAVYGGRRGGGFVEVADQGFGYNAERGYGAGGQKPKPWEIKVESEHELVYTKGQIASRDDEFHFGRY